MFTNGFSYNRYNERSSDSVIKSSIVSHMIDLI